MRWGNILVLLLAFLTAVDAGAAEKAVLRKMVKIEDGPQRSRIFLEFSRLPVYRLKTSGQRVDLLLRNVAFDPLLRDVPEDGTIVKVDRESSGTEVMLSFFLRRAPWRVDSSFSLHRPARQNGVDVPASSSSLVLNIIWEEPVTATQEEVVDKAPAESPPLESQPTVSAAGPNSRPAVVDTLSDVSRRKIDSATAGRFVGSSFKGRWRDFFVDFNTPPTISAPMQYFLPPFPCLAIAKPGYENELAPSIIEDGRAGKWQDVLATIRKVTADRQMDLSPALILLKADALARNHEYDKALLVTADLRAAGHAAAPAVLACGRYLSLYARTAAGHPYGVAYELSAAPLSAGEKSLAPYFNLLAAEIYIMTGRQDKALKVLACEEEGCAGSLENMYILRRADALFAAGRKSAAFDVYRRLLRHPGVIKRHPFSLANFAETLYRQKEYVAANEYYKHLGVVLTGHRGQALAFYWAAMSRLKSGDGKDMRLLFENIMHTFPGTEGALRARIKINDLGVLSGDEGAKLKAVQAYGEIAAKAPLRELRGEAAFKQVLALHLLGERLRCVRFLRDFIRDYGGGMLRDHAEALQVELLPAVIKDLIAAKDYLQALTLAEQNRRLLISGRINSDFLAELGLAFAALWLWKRAARVYSYMLDIAGGRAGEAKVYLPLIEAYYNNNDFGLVEEYSVDYLKKFPAGADRGRIYYLRTDSLYKNGKVEQAADLLGAGKMPKSKDLHILAGKVFWDLGKYAEVDKHLAKVMSKGMESVEPDEIFLRAEALFQLGKGRKALPFYQYLIDKGVFADQAAYRCAQIKLAAGKDAEAVKLLQRLAEKSISPLWRKMAVETLAVKKM